jgi:D-alanyl-D-alanine carboxypeptidase
MMTLYLLFEAMDSGRITPETQIRYRLMRSRSRRRKCASGQGIDRRGDGGRRARDQVGQ